MATLTPASSLGPELLRCRRRSYAAVHWELSGCYGVHQLILVPAIVGLFGGGGLCMVIDKTIGLDALGLPDIAPLFLMVTVFIGLLLWEFMEPESNLVLHKHGFIYKRRRIRFSQLRRVLVGQDTSFLGELASGLRLLMAWHPASKTVERSASGTVTLKLDGNETVVMKNVLWENDADDAQRFFGFIQQEYPEIRFQS